MQTTVAEQLYIHVPFCHRICPYCSFYKHLPGKNSQGDLVTAMLAEATDLADSRDIQPRTIYLGGGTPSLLKAEHLANLFAGLESTFDLSLLEEASMEANPRTFDADKAQAFHDIGIHRISLGVQSWDPEVLKTLGRDHSPDEAEEAYQLLRSAEIPSVNLDLMFSIPGQSQQSWEDTLARTIGLKPDHISAYNLNYEEDTEFFEKLGAGEFSEDEETDADHFSHAMDQLDDAGFEHYEISNYAQPGKRSLHNQAYWAGKDYLALGPGAVSTLDGVRTTNIKDTTAYTRGWLAGEPPARESEPLSEEARLIERIALGLRRSDGMDRAVLPPTALEDLLGAGLVETDGADAVRLTRRGRMLADPVVGHLVDALA